MAVVAAAVATATKRFSAEIFVSVRRASLAARIFSIPASSMTETNHG
jgi:hypothetical protein